MWRKTALQVKMGKIYHETQVTNEHLMVSAVNRDGLETALIIQYVIICSRSMLSPVAGAASVWESGEQLCLTTKHWSIFCHFGRM